MNVVMFTVDLVVTATIDPAMITGDAGNVPVNLTCTASVIPTDIISAAYVFTWRRNETVIDTSNDTRIMVCMCNIVCY